MESQDSNGEPIADAAASVAVDTSGVTYLGMSRGVMALSADGSTVLLADNALGSPTVLTLDGLGGLYGLTPGCNSTAGAYIPISPVLECAVKL